MAIHLVAVLFTLISLAQADLSPDRTKEIGEATQRWIQAGFTNPSVDILHANEEFYTKFVTQKMTHGLSVTAVILRNANWTPEEALPRLFKTASILAQCGIKLVKVTLVYADAPDGKVDIEGLAAIKASKFGFELARRTPPGGRPVLYYVRGNNEEEGAYSFALTKTWMNYWAKADSVSADTIYITTKVKDESANAFRDPSYNVEAHELGHLIGDMGHYEGPDKNLMSFNPYLTNDKINSQQCIKMRSSSLLTRLK